jgi:hypothetical protein
MHLLFVIVSFLRVYWKREASSSSSSSFCVCEIEREEHFIRFAVWSCMILQSLVGSTGLYLGLYIFGIWTQYLILVPFRLFWRSRFETLCFWGYEHHIFLWLCRYFFLLTEVCLNTKQASPGPKISGFGFQLSQHKQQRSEKERERERESQLSFISVSFLLFVLAKCQLQKTQSSLIELNNEKCHSLCEYSVYSLYSQNLNVVW